MAEGVDFGDGLFERFHDIRRPRTADADEDAVRVIKKGKEVSV